MKLRGRRMIVGVVVLVLLLLSVATIQAYGGSGKVCRGVSVVGVSLSGLSAEKAEEKLRRELPEDVFNTPIHLSLGDVKKTVVPADFLAAYDYKGTVENALQYAHKGNYFSRIGAAMRTWFAKKKIPASISYDEAAYQDMLHTLLDDVGEKVTEYSWEAKDEKLIVTNGSPGLLPDEKSVSDAILRTIGMGGTEKEIVFPKEHREPAALEADALYDEVYAEAADASYVIENGKVVLHPHVVGMRFDKEQAEKEIKAHKEYGETFEIPLEITQPEVTLEDIEKKLFSEVIGEYETRFNAGDEGRTKNIVLASNKINGTILAPNEVFSYNTVVGERSYSEGFQTAKVYINGESVDGVGGGICQVSSTLFNAVVYANLEIVERVNHQLTVSYVPLGRDATVDYGNIDFRFRNNTDYPIKIVCSAENGTMYTAIYGYCEDKSVRVSFDTVTTGYTPPPEKRINDPALPRGEEKIVKKGTNGYLVDTYKIVKRDGKEDERTLLCRSTYRGSIQEIHVGTGEPKPEELPEEPTPTPNVHPTPAPHTQKPATPSPSAEETEEPAEPEYVSDNGL
ncbi:MAG: VanW family protein [Clostridia bacterium]|nr:VanW family protein [Clostridia bacterium]